ncbi:MAG TPA: hypothetical protein VN914_10620, partial [Polyangia bacterium]|nr:hypothetical protein [Polyangia bacterium]
QAEGSATALQYIQGLLDAELDPLWNDTVFGPGQKPLLYMLLRHSLLLEYIRTARFVLRPDVFASSGAPDREPEFWPQFFFSNHTLKEFLAKHPPQKAPPNAPDPLTMFQLTRFELGDDPAKTTGYFRALEKLKVTPPDELTRLLSETLDTVSHRLDAWITAFATHRLANMRAAQIQACQKPIGNFLGGYGWVEDLRPGGTQPLVNDGFVHAPSMAHASAAAILRCGFSAYQKSAENKYAIDLSSERARRAQRLVEEVRAGQTLGAALGYRFERGLHESQNVPGIDAFIYRFRHLFPQVANKSLLDPFEKVETVAARNVVDGLKLVREPNIDFSPANGLPAPGTAAFNAIQAELTKLRELFDAVADLVNAEAVYQMATGDVASAQANVDFLPNGQNAPDPELVRAEGAGIGVSHRVMLLMTPDGDDQPPGLPTAWPDLPDFDPDEVAYERSRAEPFLEAWVGNLVGAADKVKALVRYKDGSGNDKSYAVKLSDLALRPLDLLAIAQDETLPNADQELQRRILAAPQPSGTVKERKIDYDVDEDGILTFPQVMELLRAAAAMLGGARPVFSADLVTPLEISTLGDDPELGGALGLKQRADDALVAMKLALTQLEGADDPAGQRTAMVNAARFIVGAFPPTALDDPEEEDVSMATARDTVLGELRSRRDQAALILKRPPELDSDSDGPTLRKKATDLMKAVFGRSFFALPSAGVLPETASDELQRSLDARAALLGTGPGNQDPLADSAPVRFLQQVALVRDGSRRWRSMSIYSRTLGRTPEPLTVMQLPHVPGEAWAGRVVPPAPGRISLLAYPAGGFPTLGFNHDLRGILIDDWVEAIPRATEETGLAFHFDHPNAEAPQAVLVAVPAAAGPTWSFADLLGAVTETFDLTDVRSINPESLPISALVPSPSLAFAPQKDTVSTDFADNKVQDRATRARVVVPPGG